MSPLAQLIRESSQDLTARPVEIEERLPALRGIRCLAFDIYGTLFISASGDIEANANSKRDQVLRRLLADHGIKPPEENLEQILNELILEDHAVSRGKGIEFPEVDIREIWGSFFDRIGQNVRQMIETEEFAVRYELAVNPVWPMPGAQELLEWAQAKEITLALVSNAQFNTPLMFEAFLEKTPQELGFPNELSFFSYNHGQAKPGTHLYKGLKKALSKRGILAKETLFVGNDALNDIHPAGSVGFKTALFAGSVRSLRLREDRGQLNPPDAIVRSLDAIKGLLT